VTDFGESENPECVRTNHFQKAILSAYCIWNQLWVTMLCYNMRFLS
jgi:hypothetical protein